ncbi:MAG: hypothetical protein Q9191_006868 [Dirinaria sp. TL-2023a]
MGDLDGCKSVNFRLVFFAQRPELEAKTAQHETDCDFEKKEEAMSNEHSEFSQGNPADADNAGHEQSRTGQVVDTTTGRSSSPDKASAREEAVLVNGNGVKHGKNGKSDSEAETVVLSGKEDGTAKKVIKHEDASDTEARLSSFATKTEDRKALQPDRNGQNGMRKPSLKRKRAVQEVATNEALEGGNSSNLSSTFSSPAPQTRSDKDNGSGSEPSRVPRLGDGDAAKKSRLRRRKLERDDEQDARQRRGKSDPSSGLRNGQERRGKRRVKELDTSSTRSESPPAHQHVRQHSSHAGNIHTGVKRRKAPPSLSIERRRKASEDTHPESDDSNSAQNRLQLQKSASIDEHAMAKTSHKKILDKSGRTPVARACANDNIEQLSAELKERPHHLNEPDYAENTPLQIAALEGFTETVQFLLDEGCIVDCKNVDGDTPLIDAVENGHLDVVMQLLKAGADPRLRNGRGDEPLDLVKQENDNYDAIRDALLAAKAKESLRRASEDQSAGTRDNDGASVSASAGSPTDSTQSKAVAAGNEGSRQFGKTIGLGGEAARRKTARSQATREGLLWISATPERLREAASKGDLEVVGHILNTRPADTESMLVAARGGHDVVLQLLIALGRNPEPDPEPLSPSDYKPGQNTPMLAAIGGGNIKVVELLLKQSGFDPTRRLYRGCSYYELAKQRQGSNWQQEYDILKEAYDNYVAEGGRRSTHGSPRKIRAKRPEASSSPRASPNNERSEDGMKRQSSQRFSYHKHIRADDDHKDASAVASDREAESLAPPKIRTKAARSVSDVGSLENSRLEAIAKPRRRLMSKNEISDHDLKRRASAATEGSPCSSNDIPTRKSSDTSVAVSHDRKVHKEPSPNRQEPNKKRPRVSTSLRSGSADHGKFGEIVRKKRRIETEGDAVEQDNDTHVLKGPTTVPNMIASPEPILSPLKTPGSAPVAFMGGHAVTSPKVRSPAEARSNTRSPFGNIDRALQHEVVTQASQSPRIGEHNLQDLGAAGRSQSNIAGTTAKDNAPTATAKADPNANDSASKEEQERTAHDPEPQPTRTTEAEADRQRKAEEVRLKAALEAAEAERQLQIEREEEEARALKIRNEELQARRAEQERQQREKEERRKAEMEHREEMRRLRLQEEREQQRRDALPNGLRRAAELNADEARDLQWINKWLPLYTVETSELDPNCSKEEMSERWVANIQVAPLLANKDLELSQYTAWHRRPITVDQRGSLWRLLRNQQSGTRIPCFRNDKDEKTLYSETRPKFFTMEPMFWIRYTDFMDIVPRHPHLSKELLYTRAMALHQHPFGVGGTWENECAEGRFGVRREEEMVTTTTANHEAVTGPTTATTTTTTTTNGLLVNGHV